MHTERRHGGSVPQMREVEIGEGEPITYAVCFPRATKTAKCPVIGYPEIVHSAGRLREHFMYRKISHK